MLSQVTCVMCTGDSPIQAFPWDDLPAVLREAILAKVPLVRLAQIAHYGTEFETALGKRQAAHLRATACWVQESSNCPAFRDEVDALLAEARMRDRPRHRLRDSILSGGAVPEPSTQPVLPAARTREACRHWYTRMNRLSFIPPFPRVQCLSRFIHRSEFSCAGAQSDIPMVLHGTVSFEVVVGPWRCTVRRCRVVIWFDQQVRVEHDLAICLNQATALAASVRQLLHEHAGFEVPGNRRTRLGNVGAVESIKLVLPYDCGLPNEAREAAICEALSCILVLIRGKASGVRLAAESRVGSVQYIELGWPWAVIG
jgi:hypothetical protein